MQSIHRREIDDIDTEIIAMHYGIVWGERQRVFPQD